MTTQQYREFSSLIDITASCLLRVVSSVRGHKAETMEHAYLIRGFGAVVEALKAAIQEIEQDRIELREKWLSQCEATVKELEEEADKTNS